MSTNAHGRNEGIDRAAGFSPGLRQHVCLGVDAEGFAHHLDRATATVHRIRPATGTRERTTDLLARGEPAPAALETYIHDFVGGAVGWADRRKLTGRDLFGGDR